MIAVTASTSKVGDTLTAEVVDLNGEDVSDNVTFQWYADDKAIEGADEETLVVDDDLLGAALKVVVTAENGNVFESEATAAVYASLALLSADQTGKSVVTLTTNGPVTALDDIDVLKGTKEVEIDSIDYEDDGAVVTLKNAIVADAEYTVTLTPADEDDEATSATFVGEKAKLDRIEFLNDVLVMKDQNYNEGYAYVKGYDQFDDPVTLSGLTVTPGVGRFKSYDNTTGKITLVDDNWTAGSTGAFMLIKEVPVFVQYQTGNDVISAQETLKVSTQAYVSELTFGEIKKDGTPREDGLLTLEELGSGKYYVEIEEVLDQYGNTLSADDLNAQKDGGVNGTSKTLFVIPGEDSGAFYKTGKFAELNGKTILWLQSAGAQGKPGTMALTITGAGGKTFSTDVTIMDNPYIDVLNVTYPELYAGSEESAELEFSAVDQYGEAIDLWAYRPKNGAAGEIVFGDKNAMTTLSTKITVSGGKGTADFNTVIADAGKKSFKVTLDVSGEDAKTLLTFTEQTAGMKVRTHSITVGEMGTAAKVKSSLKSGANLQVDDPTRGTNDKVNFNKFIQFEDANGNEMIRGKSERYPYYVAIVGKSVEATLPVSTDAAWTANASKYVWSLTTEKVQDVNAGSTNASTIGTDGSTTIADITDGVVEYADITGDYLDVYATVYLLSSGKYYKLDEKTFHLTKVKGADKSYTAKAANTIFCDKDNGKTTEIKVEATTDSGEKYTVKKDRVAVTPKAPFSIGDNAYTVTGADASALGTGTTTATVYVKECKLNAAGNLTLDTNFTEETTVDINYTNAAPVATKVSKKFEIVDDSKKAGDYVDDDAAEYSRSGAAFDGSFDLDSFELDTNAALTIEDGELTITDAIKDIRDTLTFGIADQYGRSMSSTTFYVDGKKIEANYTVPSTKDVTVEWANGTLTGKVILEQVPAATVIKYVPATTASSVDTETRLTTELAKATKSETDNDGKTYEITITEDIETAKALTVPSNTKLIVDEGVKLDTKANDVTIAAKGELVINGLWVTTGAAAGTKITNNGSVTGSGHATLTGATVTKTAGADSKWEVEADTLVLVGCTITGGSFGGHVQIEGATTITNPITLLAGVTFDLTGSTLTGANNIEVDTLKSGEKVTIITQDGVEETIEVKSGEDKPSDLPISDGDFIDVANKDAEGAGDGKPVVVSLPTNEVSISGTKTIDKGVELVVENGQTLTIAPGATLTVNGTITNNGTVVNNGTLENNGTFENNGGFNKGTGILTGTPIILGTVYADAGTKAGNQAALLAAYNSMTGSNSKATNWPALTDDDPYYLTIALFPKDADGSLELLAEGLYQKMGDDITSGDKGTVQKIVFWSTDANSIANWKSASNSNSQADASALTSNETITITAKSGDKTVTSSVINYDYNDAE